MCYTKLKSGLIDLFCCGYYDILNNCVFTSVIDSGNLENNCVCGKQIRYLYYVTYNNKEFILGSSCIQNIINKERENLDIKKFQKQLYNKCIGCKKFKIDKNKEVKNNICLKVCSSCRIGYNKYYCRKCKKYYTFDNNKKCLGCVARKERKKGIYKCIDCKCKMKNDNYDKCFNCHIKNKIKCITCHKRYISRDKFNCYDCYKKLISIC